MVDYHQIFYYIIASIIKFLSFLDYSRKV